MTRGPILFKKRSLTFNLNATSIDQASDWLVENLQEADVDKSDRLRTRLLFEEALINMAEHYGADQEVTARLSKRQGRYRLRVTTNGDMFNPLKPETDDEQDDLSMSLFSVLKMNVQYSHSAGSNVLRISLPKTYWNPVLKIIIAIAIGTFVGLLGNVVIPNAAQEAFTEAILNPISDMWIRLLQAIAGPIIFLTALTATFGTKRIADFGGSRLITVVRYFAISTAVMIFTLACAMPFFPLDIAATEASRDTFSNVLEGILRVLPENLISPFTTADTPQLLLIAIVTGYVLAAIEPQVPDLKKVVDQLNVLGMTVAKQACSFVPFFVGLLLCLKIWTHDTRMLERIWMPLVLSAAISLLACLAVLLFTAAHFRVSPLLLARKLKDPTVEALKRGTLDFSVVDSLAGSCKTQLGINKEFARASLPQGLFLYMPTSTVGICVFILFAAQEQHLSVDQMWLVSAAALSVILAVATPPMTGANLLSFIAAFSYLSISNDAMLSVMVFDIVYGVFCVAFDQLMLQIETINQASRMGFLNEKVLRAPLAE